MCERGALCHHDIILKSVCDGRQAGRRASSTTSSGARSAARKSLGGTNTQRADVQDDGAKGWPFCAKKERQATKLVKKVASSACKQGAHTQQASTQGVLAHRDARAALACGRVQERQRDY